MAKKNRSEKTPKKRGWDFFRVLRRMTRSIKPSKWLKSLKSIKWRDPKIYRSALFSLAILCVLAAVLGIYGVVYADKVYPNIAVAGVQVGNQNKAQVKKTLDQVFNKIEAQPIKLTYKDKVWELTPKDIKLVYNESKTQQQVMTIGREKKISRRLWSRLAAIGKANEVAPVYSYDEAALNSFIDKIAGEVDIPEKDATGVIKGNNVTFVKERSGYRVQKDKLSAQFKNDFSQLKSSGIKVYVAEILPKVTLGDTEEARQQVLAMLKGHLTLKWQNGTFNVGPDVFNDWIKFKSEAIKNQPKNYHLVAYVGDDEVKAYLKKISKNIDANPKNAKLAINNGVLTTTEPSAIGYAFDQNAALPTVRDAVMSGQVQTIDLNVKEVQPDVSSDNLDSLGIKEIIGTGATNFKGSTAARVANIANGARIINGTLIKPGDEFSTVKTIGNVDASTGFVIGLVIKGTKTEPEYGGGLCQVSTTLFRAALYSGLKVTERTNHAYRVGYYETDGDGKKLGPGLDSTIYGPHPDLRFVNDTSHWILIQGRVEGNKITFDFWGTKDGRVATIDGPHVSNETPAPAAEYINTDTLYVGQKQQMEGSHPGATAVVNYSVVRDGKEIIKQTFKSVFKPWGAKYLVGTKPLPTVAPATEPVVTPTDPTVPAAPAT